MEITEQDYSDAFDIMQEMQYNDDEHVEGVQI